MSAIWRFFILFLFLSFVGLWKNFLGAQVYEDNYERAGLTLLYLDKQPAIYSNAISAYFNKEGIVPEKTDDNMISRRSLSIPLSYRQLEEWNTKKFGANKAKSRQEKIKEMGNKAGDKAGSISDVSGIVDFIASMLPKTMVTSSIQRDNVINTVTSCLIRDNVDRDVIGRILNRQPDGSFDIETLKERGAYSSRAADYVLAGQSIRGQAYLSDKGEALLSNAYIMIVFYQNIMKYEEFYTSGDAGDGYLGDATAFLYKVNINDSLLYVLYKDLWLDGSESQEEKKIRKARFDNTRFPIEFVASVNAQLIDGSGSKSLNNLLERSIEILLRGLESSESSLRLKAPITTVKPRITAKVGTKEGVRPYNRFTVWENTVDKEGNIIAKKRGTVRSAKVAQNEGKNYDESDVTTFYQVGGKKLGKGMLLEHKNDLGLRLNLGWSFGNIAGAEAQLSFGHRIRGYGLLGTTSVNAEYTYDGPVRLPATTGFLSDPVLDAESTIKADYSLIRYGLGVHYDYYFLRNFSIGLSLGYAAEKNTGSTYDVDVKKDGNVIYSEKLDPESFSYVQYDPENMYEYTYDFEQFNIKHYFTVGAELGINIIHFMQVYGSANYYFGISSKGGNMFEKDFVGQRKGYQIQAGLRFQF